MSCFDTLYVLDLAKIDSTTSTTSTIQSQEIKWKKDLGRVAEPLLLGSSQNLYVIQYGFSNHSSFSIFNKDKEPVLVFFTSILPDLFESYLIDKNENIYGVYGWGGLRGIILNEDKDNIASFIDSLAGSYFSFPPALSKEGTLYIPAGHYKLVRFKKE